MDCRILFGGAVIGAVVAPFIYFSNENQSDYARLLTDMDKGQLLTFRSVDDCTAKGMPSAQCAGSRSSAFSWAQGLGTSASYSSLEACSRQHGSNNCPEVKTMTPLIVYSGNVPVTNYTYQTSYNPSVIAWQTAANDLNKAVPLYPTAAGNIAIRYDGKRFALGG